MQRKCIIVGGGIAGLSAGIAMRKAGYAVALYEQADAVEPMGAALSIWGNAMAGLDWLGCGDALREQAAPIRQVSLERRYGRTLMGPMDVSASDSYLPRRAILQEVLLAHLGPEHVRLGVTVDGSVEQDGQVSITADGITLDTADILIAADGIHSQIAREQIGGEPRFAGYVGALGLCDMPDQPLPPGFAQEIWGEGERFGVFDAGNGARYWFYMRSAKDSAAQADMTLPELQQSADGWPELVRDTVTATATCIPVSVHAKPPPKSMGNSRTICIGDAAHPMEPNQGQGACQSIEDAWALGVLAQRLPPEAILPELERQRLKRVGRFVRDSALMGKAAHMRSGLIRSAIMGSFAMTPRWINDQQLLGRLKAPEYR